MKNQKVILVIDDDENIQIAVQDILESAGYSVRICGDGKEGFRAIEKRDFDLALCDIVMSDMDGMEFLRRLKKAGHDMPVIIMSGNQVGIKFVNSAQLLGARTTLVKPFSETELLQAVMKAFNEK